MLCTVTLQPNVCNDPCSLHKTSAEKCRSTLVLNCCFPRNRRYPTDTIILINCTFHCKIFVSPLLKDVPSLYPAWIQGQNFLLNQEHPHFGRIQL